MSIYVKIERKFNFKRLNYFHTLTEREPTEREPAHMLKIKTNMAAENRSKSVSELWMNIFNAQ